MADEEFLFQADIDNKLAIAALKEMEAAAKKLEASGDASFQSIGTEIDKVTKALKKNQQELEGGSQTQVKQFKQGLIGIKDFRTGLTAMLADIRKVVKESEGLAKGLDFSGVFEDVGTIELDEIIDVGAAEAGIDNLIKLTDRLARSTVAGASEMAAALRERLVRALDDSQLSGKELRAELRRIRATAIETFKGLGETPDTDVSEALKADVVLRQMELIKSKGQDLMASSNASMRDFGNNVVARADELQDLFNRNQISAKQFASEMSTLGKQLNDTLKAASVEGLKPMDEVLNLQRTIGKLSETNKLIDQMAASTSGNLVIAGQAAADKIAELHDQFKQSLITPKQLEDGITDVNKTARALLGTFKEYEEIQVAESLGLADAEVALVKVREQATKLASSTTTEAKKAGAALLKNAEILEQQYERGAKSLAQFTKEAGKLETKATSLNKKFGDLIKKDITKPFDTSRAQAEIKSLEGTVEHLTKSTSQEAQEAGETLEKVGKDMERAWIRGEVSAEELISTLRKLRSEGQRLGRTYGAEMEDSTNRGTASIWKMSRALDSVGIRGGGSILRVVDGIKNISPAAIVAGAAILGIALAVMKLGELAINVGRKLGKMFLNVTKDAVEVAASFEAVEAQLTNIFQGKTDLARQTLARILDLSAEFGVDLAGEISQIFLPLVDSFAQFEEIAELSSTLAAKTGKDVDTIARALKQGVAGHFRPLQEQFGVLQGDIENIKRLQEDLGDTTGLIQGMQDFFDRTGTSWDTFEGTLRRVRGQVEQTVRIFKLEFGEPVKIALVEQLQAISKWFQDNRAALQDFFRDLGESVGKVVTGIGEFLQSFLESINEEDLDEIATRVSVIAEQIQMFLDNIADANFDFVIDSLLFMLEVTNRLVLAARRFVAFVTAGKQALNLDLSDLALLATGPQAIPGLIAQGVGENIGQRLRGEETGVDQAKETIAAFEEEQRALQELIEKERERREERRKTRDAVVDTSEDEADAMFKLNALTAEQSALLEKVKTAADELNEAFEDFNTEMERAFRDIFVEEGRRRLDNMIANAQKRLDLATKHREALEDIDTKADVADFEREKDRGRKEEDIHREHNRKLRENDIDEARKVEDLLERHLNRLKEIREKFDLDAQEAIRMNDAVALLRIRRRMELELRQENRRFDIATERAVDAAQDKRDKLDRLLQDELDDLRINNERKIEDIEDRHDQEVDAEKVKYARLLEQQEIEEERKAAALALWLKREEQDFNQMWLDKNADLINRMDDAIDIYEDGMDRLLEINAAMALLMAQGVQIPFSQGFGQGFNIPFEFFGVQQPAGGLSSRFNQGTVIGQAGDTPITGSDVPLGSTPPTQQSTDADLRNLALHLADQLGLNAPSTTQLIIDATRDELVALVLEWQRALNAGGHQGRRHGGITNVNVPYTVNEDRGNGEGEGFVPIEHGIVAPQQRFIAASQAAPQLVGNIDNSRNMSADISLLDPNSMTEIQKTLIRSFVTDILLGVDF